MNRLDFNEKNMEYLAYQMEGEIEKAIYETIQDVQAGINTEVKPEFLTKDDWQLVENGLNAIEILYKVTLKVQSQEGIAWGFNLSEYIAFLHKYNLRDYLDISKL